MSMVTLRVMNFIVGMEEMSKMPKLKFVVDLGVGSFILHTAKGLSKDS
jgi:hypothetical protein